MADQGTTAGDEVTRIASDAKQFGRLGMACYGYTPLVLPPGYDYFAMFHGVDERVPVSALHASLRIMDRLLTGTRAV